MPLIPRFLRLALAPALAFAALAVAPLPAAAQSDPSGLDKLLVCLKEFFETGGNPTGDCKGTAPIGGGGSLSTPVSEGCPPPPMATSYAPLPDWFEGWASAPLVKCGMSPISFYDGLPVYRFKYVGTDTWFYGLMIDDVLRDGRYARAVRTYPNGVQTLDYEAIGLEVPDATAMREAGWKAVQIVMPQI